MRLLDEADDLKLLRCGEPHVWSPPSPIMLFLSSSRNSVVHLASRRGASMIAEKLFGLSSTSTRPRLSTFSLQRASALANRHLCAGRREATRIRFRGLAWPQRICLNLAIFAGVRRPEMTPTPGRYRAPGQAHQQKCTAITKVAPPAQPVQQHDARCFIASCLPRSPGAK